MTINHKKIFNILLLIPRLIFNFFHTFCTFLGISIVFGMYRRSHGFHIDEIFITKEQIELFYNTLVGQTFILEIIFIVSLTYIIEQLYDEFYFQLDSE